VKLAYLGTPEMAVPPLHALVGAGHEIGLVITRPDARRSRRGLPTPSPVKAAAQDLGLTVSHDLEDLVHCARGDQLDLGVVVAYGHIIKPHVLEQLAMINLHFSLLPRWRGAAPVERALLSGDEVTGVCVMEVAEGLDTGDVYARVDVPIGDTTTAAELRVALVDAGTRLLLEELAVGLGTPQPQIGEPTYARKLTVEELRIDWSRPAAEIDRLVRVGGAWTTFRNLRVKIHAARLVDGRVQPLQVQPEGKPVMTFEAWRNGARPTEKEWFQ
jgi:methionyl-tRNA formyltransferase